MQPLALAVVGGLTMSSAERLVTWLAGRVSEVRAAPTVAEPATAVTRTAVHQES